MKKNIIIKGVACLASLAMMTGCSDSYLDLAPVTEPSPASFSQSASSAYLGALGVARCMNSQYSKTNWNQFSGEGYVNTILGEGLGVDAFQSLATSFGDEAVKWNTWANRNYIINYIMWQYCYNVIYCANGVLDGLAAASEEVQNEPIALLAKAECLSYRAHGYIKLMQFYGPRYEDDPNGELYVCPLRTTASLQNVPLAQTKDIKAQIYKDLDDAIAAFDATTATRKNNWEPSREVACGLYARAAMLFHDYAKAQQMAHDAQNGFTMMDNNTLFAGFYADNSDFMWSSSDNPEDIYYWSWGSHWSCNGKYVDSWGDIGAGAISVDLMNQADPKDVRRGLFLTPDKIDAYASDKNMNPGGLTSAAFWSADCINAENMNMNIGLTSRDKNNPDKLWGMPRFIVKWGLNYKDKVFKGDLSQCVDESSPFVCYFGYGSNGTGDGSFVAEKGLTVCLKGIQIGAQYKFWSLAPYGCLKYPFMRSTEMLLTEAEAAYMNGDQGTAQTIFEKLQKVRVPGYVSKTGEALLAEIKLSRRLELWGEGFGFPDLKRWNTDAVRRAWIAGDPTSGNFPKTIAMKRGPKEQAGWRLRIPLGEMDYNDQIDEALLPPISDYTDVTEP